MDSKAAIKAHLDYYGDNVAIVIGEQDSNGSLTSVVKTLTIETRKRGEYVEPTLRISMEAAQSLFNELWRDGFRPKDGTGNSGHILAVERHLADMRKLVFEKKK